jgi:YidC/Oxa1 family membrane protein insertase
MAKMRKLAPRLQNLKERYGDDRQKLHEGMMKIYQEEKINPMGGCLPILVQIPVFIALYWVLMGRSNCVRRRSRCGFRIFPSLIRITFAGDHGDHFVYPGQAVACFTRTRCSKKS